VRLPGANGRGRAPGHPYSREPKNPFGVLYFQLMSPKLYKAAEVCDVAQLQPYVLRSWEKEFPGIGVQKSADNARLYRQSDVDQVLRIKQLVFGEGLTLSGARRRLEESTPAVPAVSDAEVAEVLEALASDARTRIASVRDGLKSILRVLSSAPGTVVVVDEFQLAPVTAGAKPSRKGAAASSAKGARSAAARSKPRVVSKPVARKKAESAKTKRGRASA
jgi:DNA-binding transcriptional MerR regulator